MKYKIGDVARILGISTDLLRYYEKKGVVKPEKDENNDYRYYDSWDINFLVDCLWFKNYGFSIEQIADMVKIPGVPELEELFFCKEEELRATIKRCQLLLRRSESYRADLRKAQEELYQCRVADSPEFVRFINRRGREYSMDASTERMARQWLSAMPFNRRYFEMSAETLRSGREDYGWGFSMSMDYVQELDFDMREPIVRMPPRRSIHTVFKSSGGRNGFAPSLLQYALDYADNLGEEITGPVHGTLLASVMEDEGLTGYFEAWLPIE
jgi:DNA-binding transcriptional MerR regulator